MRHFAWIIMVAAFALAGCLDPAPVRIDRNSPPQVVFPDRNDLAPKAGLADDPNIHYLTSPMAKNIRRTQKFLPQGVTTVYVMFIVEIDGTVNEAKVIESSGNKALDSACLKVIRKWRLNPPAYQGTPMATAVVLPIQFQN